MIYFIVYMDENIKISHYDTSNQIFEVLKNKGEQWQKYDTNFWTWFKKKIEYSDEELSFAILYSTQETNKIQISQDIKISKINYISKNTQAYSLIKEQEVVNTKIEFIPTFKVQTQQTTPVSKTKKQEIKQGSLAHYYIEETKANQKR